MGLLFKNRYAYMGDGKGYVREAREYVDKKYKEKGYSIENLPYECTVRNSYFRDEDDGCETLTKYINECKEAFSFNTLMTNLPITKFADLLKEAVEELKGKGYYNVAIKRSGSNFYLQGERKKTTEELEREFKNCYDTDVYIKAKQLKEAAHRRGETAEQKRKDLQEFERLKAKLGK